MNSPFQQNDYLIIALKNGNEEAYKYLYENKYKFKESLSEKIQKTAVLELIECDYESKQQKLKYIAQLIEQLPPKRKEIFILSKTEGLTYEEIASHLDLSVKTI